MPQNWRVCNATDTAANGVINYKIGAWNEEWKLFMVFGSVSKPIKGYGPGILVSAYVEAKGIKKLRCNWDDNSRTEFNRLKSYWERKMSPNVTVEKAAKPIAVGAIIGGIAATTEALAKFLGMIVIGSF